MSLPYFALYPKDFEAKTSHLSMIEDGAYNRLLRLCWMTPSCTIPADEAWVMRRMRAHTDDEKAAVRAVLAEFFERKNGRYINVKLTEVWLDAKAAHERRKNAGSKGGLAKSLKANQSASSNAKAGLKQPKPKPKDIPNGISPPLAPPKQQAVEVPPQPPPKERASRAAGKGDPLPDGWVPDRASAKRLKDKHDLTRDELQFCYDQMKEHAYATGRRQRDWNAAYRMWVGKAANDGQIGPGCRSRRSAKNDDALDRA